MRREDKLPPGRDCYRNGNALKKAFGEGFKEREGNCFGKLKEREFLSSNGREFSNTITCGNTENAP